MDTLLQFIPYWSFYLRHPSPESLVVTAPPHIIPFLVVTITMWRWAFKGLGSSLRKGTATPTGVVYISILFLLAVALVTPNASLTLDRSTNTVTIRRFFIFWIPYVKRIPLSQVEKAGTQEAPLSTRFYLQTVDGNRYHLSSWDGLSGQGKGANAVNEFLVGTPGTHLSQQGSQTGN